MKNSVRAAPSWIRIRGLRLAGGITLTPVRLRDARELFALIDASRDGLRTWLPWVDATRQAEDTRNFIRFAIDRCRQRKAVHMAIREKGRIVGMIGFHTIDLNHRSASVGYWLGAAYQGRGVMTRSCRALVDWGFAKLGLNRIEVRAASGNRRSCAIARGLGFRKEGMLREAESVNGRLLDHAVFSRLRRERNVSRR